MLFCRRNQLQCWEIWQILKLALRLAVNMLGLMCQWVGLQSSPCSPTGIRHSLQANIFWHFPWQPATICARGTTVGDGMIAKWPNKNFIFLKRRGKFVWCLSVCLLLCEHLCGKFCWLACLGLSLSISNFQNYSLYLFERLNSTLTFF